MLVHIGSDIINTAHIIRVEDGIATLTSGEKVSIKNHSILDRSDLCGTIVPAAPGYILIEAFIPTETRHGPQVNYHETAIVAFRVLGGIQSPKPIGLRGEPMTTEGSEYAVIQPDGRCIGWEQIWPDRAAFIAHCEDLAERNRARIGGRAQPAQGVSRLDPPPTTITTDPHLTLRARILAEPIEAPFPGAPWQPGRDFGEIVDEVRRAHPDLHEAGVGYSTRWGWKWESGTLERHRTAMTTPGNVEAFEAALRFLSHAGRNFAQTRVNRKRTSYSWKHVAGRVMGVYVPNGMLIAAAYALGFRVEVDRDSPNPRINLAEKAVELDPQGGT